MLPLPRQHARRSPTLKELLNRVLNRCLDHAAVARRVGMPAQGAPSNSCTGLCEVLTGQARAVIVRPSVTPVVGSSTIL